MLINSLPDPAISFNKERPRLNNNLVLHARSRGKYQYPEHATPYMLVANPNTRGKYVVNQQTLLLSGKSFLFLGAEDKLSIQYDSEEVESLFILFEDTFIYRTYHVFTSNNEHLLAHPFDCAPEKNNFRALPLAIGPGTLSLFNSITSIAADRNELDENLMQLVGKIARLEGQRSAHIENIRAIRKTTRVELYKRLFIAREYMENNFTLPRLNLDDIARNAALDKYHFILNFKQVFGTTPHQYLTGIRLKRAYDLLLSEKYSVTEVCYLTGFESLPSFSNLFKKRFRTIPSMLVKYKSSLK